MAKKKSITAPLSVADATKLALMLAEKPVPKHEVIPCSYYEDPRGVRYSPFTSWKPADAVLVTKGWTIRWNDGTEGTGRKAFETEAEAHAYLAKVPKYFRGMSMMGN